MARGRNIYTIRRSEGLIITSLIDYFSIIVIFFLKFYSAEGSLVTNADNLVLPNSTSNTIPQEVHLQIAANNEMVLLDNVPCIPTDDVRKIPQTNADPVIKELYDKLKVAYEKEEDQVRLGNLNNISGEVVIQVDKNVEFDVMYKITHTCAKAGFNKMNFAVMKREDS